MITAGVVKGSKRERGYDILLEGRPRALRLDDGIQGPANRDRRGEDLMRRGILSMDWRMAFFISGIEK